MTEAEQPFRDISEERTEQTKWQPSKDPSQMHKEHDSSNLTPSERISGMIKRAIGDPATTIHPSPATREDHGVIKLDKDQKNELASSSTRELLSADPSTGIQQRQKQLDQQKKDPGLLTKQATALLVLACAPALWTVLRVFFGNGGPSWFSFHPIMMVVSVFSMLGSMLLQRVGGPESIKLVGTLSACSLLSLTLGLFVIWTTKEMYGKPHLLSAHSHMGALTNSLILAYGLGAFYVYNPWRGTARQPRRTQIHLVTFGKATASMALIAMAAGIFEIERSYLLLLLWIGSLVCVLPFLILDWNK